MIVSNQVECQKCGDKPFSRNRHDFRYCKCGSIAVDGGTEYLRRVGDIHAYNDLSIEMPSQIIDDAIAAVEETKREGGDAFCMMTAVWQTLRKAGIDLAHNQDSQRSVEIVQWAVQTRRNARGIVYAVLRALRDDGVNLTVPETTE